jgi:hypothetical protein
LRAAALLVSIAAASFGQVQNAADAAAGIYVSSPLAPGMAAFVSDSSAAPSIGGAAVSIRPLGSASSIPAQIVGADDTGITFLVPPDAPLGNAQLSYKQADGLTQWTAVSIVLSYFALYRNPVRAVNVNATGPANPNGLANPAQPGQVVEIFGTGIGVAPQALPQVTLGLVSQKVLFAGSGGGPGVVQINFQVVQGTPDGCYLPLTVTWGAGTATSYISKTSDGSPCRHPFGLSTTELQTLDNGGSVLTGMISMTTALNAASSNRASRQESAVVLFTDLVAADLAGYFTRNVPSGCSSATAAASAFLRAGAAFPFGSTMSLRSAATTLTLTSEPLVEYTTTIPPSADAPLNNLPTPVIGGGKWTWSSPAGALTPAASFDFNISPPVQIGGGAPISLKTNSDQSITWNGSDFDSQAILQLSLSAQNFGPPVVTCFAPAQAGTITIPASMLAQFTAGLAASLSVSVTESGSGVPYASFQSPAVLMLVSRGTTDTRPVDFK